MTEACAPACLPPSPAQHTKKPSGKDSAKETPFQVLFSESFQPGEVTWAEYVSFIHYGFIYSFVHANIY